MNHLEKCLIWLVTVLFIAEKWLSLLAFLLKTGYLRSFCFEKLLKIGRKIHSSKKILLKEVARNWRSTVSEIFK